MAVLLPAGGLQLAPVVRGHAVCVQHSSLEKYLYVIQKNIWCIVVRSKLFNIINPTHPAAAPAEAAEGCVLLGVEWIHHDLLRALDLSPAEGTPAPTALGVLRQNVF